MTGWPTVSAVAQAGNAGGIVSVHFSSSFGFAVDAAVEEAAEAVRAFIQACRIDALRRLPRLGLIFVERRPVPRRDVAVPDLPRLLARALPRRQAR